MRIIAAVVVGLTVSTLAFAYAQLKSPAFEVASVRRAATMESNVAGLGGRQSTGIGSAQQDPALVIFKDMSLASLLMRAHDLSPSDITGPSWLDSERYDVVAKMPAGATMDQIPVMLQNLLLERFHISQHWENREESGYALEIGPASPKIRPVEKGRDSALPGDGASSQVDSLTFSSQGHIEIKGATMAYLAKLLSRFIIGPVADSTSLGGKFDIGLDITPEELAELRQSGAPVNSIFSAVRKLGLQLSPRRIPIRRLVIDRAEKTPTDN